MTVRGFLERGLVDEMVLTTVPVLLGDGRGGGMSLWGGLNLDGEGKRDLKWEVVGCEVMDGLVGLRYRALRV